MQMQVFCINMKPIELDVKASKRVEVCYVQLPNGLERVSNNI
jgi:hypothetical protein